jgi:hypothetical protein
MEINQFDFQDLLVRYQDTAQHNFRHTLNLTHTDLYRTPEFTEMSHRLLEDIATSVDQASRECRRRLDDVITQSVREVADEAIESVRNGIRERIGQLTIDDLRFPLSDQFVAAEESRCIRRFRVAAIRRFRAALGFLPVLEDVEMERVRVEVRECCNQLFLTHCAEVLVPVIYQEIKDVICAEITAEIQGFRVPEIALFRFNYFLERHQANAQESFRQALSQAHRDLCICPAFAERCNRLMEAIVAHANQVHEQFRRRWKFRIVSWLFAGSTIGVGGVSAPALAAIDGRCVVGAVLAERLVARRQTGCVSAENAAEFEGL